MNVFLLNKTEDFDPEQAPIWNHQELTQDLELHTLFHAMAGEDDFLLSIIEGVMLSSSKNDLATILYRQDILRDCIKNPDVAKQIYQLAIDAIEREKKNYWGILSRYPGSILYHSIELLQMFVEMLRRLRVIADQHAGRFTSAGFVRFFQMLKEELNDTYFDEIESHLTNLKFHNGILMSARLGEGNKGTDYVLHRPHPGRQGWLKRFISEHVIPNLDEYQYPHLRKFVDNHPDAFTFYISSRDESGIRNLRYLKDEGINKVANSLAQSNDHILSFFKSLRTELAFYLGCLNLRGVLVSRDEPVTFPEPLGNQYQVHHFSGLYDVCLVLTGPKRVVGNDVDANGKKLVMITGANQGGKSTFLRSVGLAQIMMQAGMFVAANSYQSSIHSSLITHFRREEDSGMKSGKLDEELARMNKIVEHLSSNSLILFNESFAATNEREGSEIARQIVRALLEHDTTIYFVTHLYEFAHDFYEEESQKAIFLRAERQLNGVRTYKLSEGKPLQTSYGPDLYPEVFVG